MAKFVGRELPQVISKVQVIGTICTPFSHKYLKLSLFLEKFKLGTIKSPVIVLVSIIVDLRSFPAATLRVYYSVKRPFLRDKALN